MVTYFFETYLEAISLEEKHKKYIFHKKKKTTNISLLQWLINVK